MATSVTDTPESKWLGLTGQVITFPEGLIGCEGWRRFILEGDPAADAVLNMACLDQAGIAFWVTDPFLLVTDYEVPISDDEARLIGLKDLSDSLVLCILTVRDQGPDSAPLVTANLMGPLVINLRERLGRQLVLSDSKYSVRHPVKME